MRPWKLLLWASILASPAVAPATASEIFTPAPDGTLVHAESGAKFPSSIAGFERVGERVFDGRGEYVGVAYRRGLDGGGDIFLTIAIVHIEQMTPKEHFLIAKPLVLRKLTNVTPISEGQYLRPGKGLDGYLGLFEAEDQGKPVGVALWTFDRGYWDLRGRVEFPRDKRAETQAAIDQFVDAFTALDQPYHTPTR